MPIFIVYERQEDRNFRNHYYEKVGFRGMEERKTIEAILKVSLS